MKHFTFTVHLSGYGKTIGEAWESAVEGFYEDPGSPYDEPYTEEEVDEDS